MVTIDQEQIRLLEKRLRGAGVDRRTFLKIAGAAMAAPAAGTLLAACGGDDDDDDPTATVPAAQPDPTATDVPEDDDDDEEEPEPTATEEPEDDDDDEEEPEPTATEEPEDDDDDEDPMGADEQVFYDWGFYNDPSSHDFNANLYAGGSFQIWSGLMTFDENFTVVPDMAESWEPNDDGSVWTFNIRPNNGAFSNGDDVTAETFVYSWRRLLTPATAAPYASILFDIVNAEEINLEGADPETLGCRAIDDWTLEVDMVGPRGIFPTIVAYIAAVPCHPPSVEANPDTWTDPNLVDEVVSNGPFKLVQWDHDAMVVLEKNENHWDAENVRLETVYQPIFPVEQGMLPYETGDLDWTVVPGPDLTRVQDDPQMSQEVIRYVYPGIWYLTPQVTIAPFDQLEVRTAVSHAVDRDRVVEVTNGQGQPMFSMMPPGLFAFFDDDEITSIQRFDPELAMAALEGTEFEGGQNWPEIVMTLRSEAHNSQIMAEDIAAQLQENLNMPVQIEVMEALSFRAALWETTLQLVFIRWFHDYPDPNNVYFDIFYSRRDTGKRQAWSNDEFDDLSILGKEQVDPADRLATYRAAEILVQEDRGYIPITYRVSYYLFKPWVKGLPINRQGSPVPDGNIYVRMLSNLYIEGREA
jgi:oligopeptide transport system substrate-binding protein